MGTVSHSQAVRQKEKSSVTLTAGAIADVRRRRVWWSIAALGGGVFGAGSRVRWGALAGGMQRSGAGGDIGAGGGAAVACRIERA